MKLFAIGDVHIADDVPICRKDDFKATQLRKMDKINEIVGNNTLLIAGDVFHTWNCAYLLAHEVNTRMPNNTMFVYGNHDLPYHSYEEKARTPFMLLKMRELTHCDSDFLYHDITSSDNYNVDVFGASWGKPIPSIINEDKINVLVQHRMCYYKEPVFGRDGDAYDVTKLFEKPEYTQYNVIITGDNHKPFVYWKDDKHVWINTGPIMRHSVTEREYDPSVTCIEIEGTIKVTRISLGADVNAVDRTEMYEKQGRDELVSEFANGLTTQTEKSLDFEHVLSVFMDNNNIRQETQEAVRKDVEEAKNEL
jgi:predicted phosphodiesterase